MSFAPFEGNSPLDHFLARSLASEPGGSHVVKRKPSPAKRSPAAAWAAWAAGHAPSDGSEFLASVTSWTEGTAAQLLRPQWPADHVRPTAPAIQDRLCHHLGLIVRHRETTYLDALELARQAVIEELRAARSS
jgi:hypothetical protein